MWTYSLRRRNEISYNVANIGHKVKEFVSVGFWRNIPPQSEEICFRSFLRNFPPQSVGIMFDEVIDERNLLAYDLPADRFRQ
jgi:hypothetical protein